MVTHGSERVYKLGFSMSDEFKLTSLKALYFVAVTHFLQLLLTSKYFTQWILKLYLLVTFVLESLLIL